MIHLSVALSMSAILALCGGSAFALTASSPPIIELTKAVHFLNPNGDGEIITVKYHELIPMLLNELQKQQRLNEDHARQIESQQRLNEHLAARLAKLEAR